jgi:hypothetical protein
MFRRAGVVIGDAGQRGVTGPPITILISSLTRGTRRLRAHHHRPPRSYGVIVRIFRVILSAAVAVSTAGLVTAVSVMPAAGAASSVSYVALGDSYSSGLGAGSYISSSGSCDRSTNAYPEQWAGANSPASFVSVACAGATTSDVVSGQVSALSVATTLVSITIGGNDAGFSGVMETCVLKSTSSCLSAVAAAKSFVAGQKLGYQPVFSGNTG